MRAVPIWALWFHRGISWLAAGLVAAALFVTAGCASPPPNDERADAPDPLAGFAAELDALREEHHIPGLSAAVVENGQVIFARGFGFASLERQVPAAPDTPYDIASVTKPLSAVVANKLVELGQIDLDRPMAEYSTWPGFCRDYSGQPSIFAKDLRCDPPVHTLRHLLSHTATGGPGERFSYNPVLYSWASRPIMAVTGRSFSALVAQYVLEPAGMTRSARRYRDLALPADLAEALAPPYYVDDSGAPVPSPPLDPQGDGAAGGVVSTVEDLAKFDIALDRGELVSPASRDRMMTPTTSAAGEALPYGLGWFIQPYEGHTLVWHSGWWEQAYSALYLKVPDRKVTLILLANSEGVWWDNPLDSAHVERSPFAMAFLRRFL